MDKLPNPLCRTANRVTIQMEYLDGTNDSLNRKKIADECLGVSLSSLEAIDPSSLQLWGPELLAAYVADHDNLKTTQAWQLLVGRVCDGFSTSGMREKSLEIVGTAISNWHHEVVEYDQLTDSIDRFFEVLIKDKDNLAEVLCKREGATRIYSLLFNGFAVLFWGITEASLANDTKNLDAAGAVAVGASLVSECSNALIGMYQ